MAFQHAKAPNIASIELAHRGSGLAGLHKVLCHNNWATVQEKELLT